MNEETNRYYNNILGMYYIVRQYSSKVQTNKNKFKIG